MIHDICYNEVIVLSDCFDKLCRHSTDNGIRRDIFGYYCSRCDNGIVSDAYSLKNGGIGIDVSFHPVSQTEKRSYNAY